MAQILCLTDPISTLDFKKDSTLRMAKAAQTAQHVVYQCDSSHVFIHKREVYAQALRLPQLEKNLAGLERIENIQTECMKVDDFDVIWVRKDPPFDTKYMELMWILSQCPDPSKLINQPKAIMEWNEKISILKFPEFIRPATVTRSKKDIAEFAMTEGNQEIIIKPLGLFGGRGVERVAGDSYEEILAKLMTLSDDNHGSHECFAGWYMVQPFEPLIRDGEIRVFAVNGKIISWCRKIPKPGEFLANTRMQARLVEHNPTKKEILITKTVSEYLKNYGVCVVGLDLINGYLSEINITSPRLLRPDIPTSEESLSEDTVYRDVIHALKL